MTVAREAPDAASGGGWDGRGSAPRAVAALTVLGRAHELRAHIHAARNVGATRREVGEVIFQQVTYGGMPVVVDALRTYAAVLDERGEPFPADAPE